MANISVSESDFHADGRRGLAMSTTETNTRDLVEQARRCLDAMAHFIQADRDLIRALADEVERLTPLRERERKQLATVIAIRGCDRCELCEDRA